MKTEKGNHIFHEGENAEELFLVKSSSIQISKETENGKELTLRICEKNSIIGESTLFDSPSTHTTTAKAIAPSELLTLGKRAIPDRTSCHDD